MGNSVYRAGESVKNVALSSATRARQQIDDQYAQLPSFLRVSLILVMYYRVSHLVVRYFSLLTQQKFRHSADSIHSQFEASKR